MVPTTAQLYRHFDRDGVLLYVGIAYDFLRRRHKSSRWFYRIDMITIEHYETRALALQAETAAIISEKPLFNLHSNPGMPVPYDPVLAKEIDEAEDFKPRLRKLASELVELDLRMSELEIKLEMGV